MAPAAESGKWLSLNSNLRRIKLEIFKFFALDSDRANWFAICSNEFAADCPRGLRQTSSAIIIISRHSRLPEWLSDAT